MQVITEEDFVPCDLALRLKECGFDWECEWFWYQKRANSDEMELRRARAADWNNDDWCVPHCSAPTLWLAQKWLREAKGVDICVWRSFAVDNGYHYQMVRDNDWEHAVVQPVEAGRCYERSLAEGIAEGLKGL